MSILKVIEIMSESPKSWEDAAQKAVTKAGESLRNIRSVFVQSQSATVQNGKIDQYRVNVKISFEVD